MSKKTSPAKAQASVEVDKLREYGRIEVRLRLIDWAGRVGVALAVGFCIWLAQPMVDDLAGRTTTVDFVAKLGWGAAAVSGAGWANSSRRRKLAERGKSPDLAAARRVLSAAGRQEEVTA